MKKVSIAIMLLCFIITGMSAAKAAAVIRSYRVTSQQTDTVRHKVYRKHRRVKRRISSRDPARVQMQLKQADKHLRDEKKVQKMQQELKKDTLHHN